MNISEKLFTVQCSIVIEGLAVRYAGKCMTPERWKKIESIYHAALERDSESRDAFLDEACRGDADTRRDVESLLATSRTTDFLERPAIELEAESLAYKNLPSLGHRYTVLGETGRGGMGTVYRVHDHEADEIIAVKILHSDIATDQKMIDRFRTELKLSRRVTHKNVCRIYDINRSGDLTYISMEFVAGESLRRVLTRLRALSIRKGVELIRQICGGLLEAHAQGIIHGDLKPENIMLDETGDVKIMDFGIARVASTTTTTALSGTPAYMSPEQAEGRPIDMRSDIYSLGLLMYEVFTGHMAFSGDTPIAVALKQIRETPPGPRSLEPLLPASLEKAIMRCLEKDPANRFQTLSEVEAALSSALEETRKRDGTFRVEKKISDLFGETAYVMAPGRARRLLLIIQAGYLCLYSTTLYYMDAATRVLEEQLDVPPNAAVRLLIVAATAGIASRIYLTSAIAWNHPATGEQFWRLFPALLLLDALWSASPLLVSHRIGIGPALVCIAGLAYLPFSQKTLIQNAYR